MARSLLLFAFALVTATAILLTAPATPATAQSATPAAPSDAPQAKRYPEVEEAIQLLKKRDRQGPIWSSGAARIYPELPRAHVMMYEMLLQMKEPNAARHQLEEAVKSNPGDPEPYVILGNIALQEKRIAEAKMDFDKAKELLAKDTDGERKGVMEQQAMSGIAQVAEIHEEWKEAEARLRDYLKSAPNDLPGHRRLAHALFWQTNAKEAYDILKAAKQIDRANAKKNNTKEVFPAAEAIMAQYYDQYEGPKSTTGNTEKWIKAALRNAPDDLPTRQVVGNWALEHGKLDLAKEHAEAALRIEASDPKKYIGSNVGRMLRGQVALREKDWPEAEKYFQQVVADSPTDFVARNNLALALVEQNDPAKKQRALTYAERNYSDANNNPDPSSTLGGAYFRPNEFDQVESAFDQAVKSVSGHLINADAATCSAYILYHQDKNWQAREVLGNILRNDVPFSMRPAAEELYEKVKDEKRPPEACPAAKTP